MRTYRTIGFSEIERQRLARIERYLRVAWPEYPDRDDRAAWKEWEGRHLRAIMRRGERFTPRVIHGALSAAETLVAALAEQAGRSYWEDRLFPPSVASGGEGGGVAVAGLVAPGTDVVGALVEERASGLRDVSEILPLLEEAASYVGSVRDDEDERWEDL